MYASVNLFFDLSTIKSMQTEKINNFYIIMAATLNSVWNYNDSERCKSYI